jgi:hydrogenase maturation protein HypF
MGRLFDAAAAILGVRQVVSYEAQAAIELEALADWSETGYYPLQMTDGLLDPTPLLTAMVTDLRRGVPLRLLAARFHNSLAQAVSAVCEAMRVQHGPDRVVLSGGVWQNMFLLQQTIARLEAAGFSVLIHRQVPANDGGLALGQAMIAAAQKA